MLSKFFIALAMICPLLLIGGVNSSNAFEITSLRSAYGSDLEAYDYGGVSTPQWFD